MGGPLSRRLFLRRALAAAAAPAIAGAIPTPTDALGRAGRGATPAMPAAGPLTFDDVLRMYARIHGGLADVAAEDRAIAAYHRACRRAIELGGPSGP